MNSKKCWIRVNQTDLNTKEVFLVAEGVGELRDNTTLIYREIQDPQAEVIVRLEQDGIEVVRKAEHVMKMKCINQKASITHIESEYGNFEIENYTFLLQIRPHCWKVGYQLGPQDQIVEQFQIEWHFKEAEA